MNREEIILKTETVKIAELNERERQIWDHGKACGKYETNGDK